MGRGDAIDVEACANCGATVDTAEWHPIAADVEPDGDVRLYAFCSRTCQEEWKRD